MNWKQSFQRRHWGADQRLQSHEWDAPAMPRKDHEPHRATRFRREMRENSALQRRRIDYWFGAALGAIAIMAIDALGYEWISTVLFAGCAAVLVALTYPRKGR